MERRTTAALLCGSPFLLTPDQPHYFVKLLLLDSEDAFQTQECCFPADTKCACQSIDVIEQRTLLVEPFLHCCLWNEKCCSKLVAPALDLQVVAVVRNACHPQSDMSQLVGEAKELRSFGMTRVHKHQAVVPVNQGEATELINAEMTLGRVSNNGISGY